MSKLSRKQRRLLERKLGITDKKNSIEEGRERHRKNLQEMKNKEIQNSGKDPEVNDSVFVYRGMPTEEYSNLLSLLTEKKWEEEN